MLESPQLPTRLGYVAYNAGTNEIDLKTMYPTKQGAIVNSLCVICTRLSTTSETYAQLRDEWNLLTRPGAVYEDWRIVQCIVSAADLREVDL